jgi:hypothetical protein
MENMALLGEQILRCRMGPGASNIGSPDNVKNRSVGRGFVHRSRFGDSGIGHTLLSIDEDSKRLRPISAHERPLKKHEKTGGNEEDNRRNNNQKLD